MHTYNSTAIRAGIWFLVCMCEFVIASLANRPDDGKALSYTHISPFTCTSSHAHTFYPAKAQIHRYVCVAFYHCPYLWECHSECVCKFIANQSAWQSRCELCFSFCSQTAIAVQTLESVHFVQRNFKNRFRFLCFYSV